MTPMYIYIWSFSWNWVAKQGMWSARLCLLMSICRIRCASFIISKIKSFSHSHIRRRVVIVGCSCVSFLVSDDGICDSLFASLNHIRGFGNLWRACVCVYVLQWSLRTVVRAHGKYKRCKSNGSYAVTHQLFDKWKMRHWINRARDAVPQVTTESNWTFANENESERKTSQREQKK